jgi:hypothetical protein
MIIREPFMHIRVASQTKKTFVRLKYYSRVIRGPFTDILASRWQQAAKAERALRRRH